MDNACVIGYGMVGKALADVFGIKKIYTRDPKETTINLREASNCDLIFICLPTPTDENGNYLTETIEAIIYEIENYGNHPIYVIRSTVYPGFAAKLKVGLGHKRVVSNPEFLSEATAFDDTLNPPFVLIGGDQSFTEKLVGFYRARVKGAPMITTDNATAEMAKLTMNAYFATKVIFANEASDACRELGANYETVKKVLEAHPYGPKNHFQIWFKNKRGVNGNCLPKDTKAYARYTNSSLVGLVNELNERYTNLKEHDEA